MDFRSLAQKPHETIYQQRSNQLQVVSLNQDLPILRNNI